MARIRHEISKIVFMIVKAVVRHLLWWMAYMPLSSMLMIASFFVLFILINLTGGKFSLGALNGLRMFSGAEGGETKISANESNVMALIAQLSLLLYLLSSGLSWILGKLNIPRIQLTTKQKKSLVVGTLTMLFIGSELSTLGISNNSAVGGVRAILVLFWLLSLLAFVVYRLLMSVARSFDDLNVSPGRSR